MNSATDHACLQSCPRKHVVVRSAMDPQASRDSSVLERLRLQSSRYLSFQLETESTPTDKSRFDGDPCTTQHELARAEDRDALELGDFHQSRSSPALVHNCNGVSIRSVSL